MMGWTLRFGGLVAVRIKLVYYVLGHSSGDR
jgi:hypothetical protein